jgi:transposase-like protein
MVSREKGKISRHEWPKILTKYNEGETIAKIARDYGCTAPAIRYIVKRIGTLKGRSDAAAVAHATPQRKHAARASSANGGPPNRMDVEWRRRVTGDIASFLVALDQVGDDPSTEDLIVLQEATDQLMRSTARIRLEMARSLDHRERAGGRAKPAKEMWRPPRDA